MPASPPFASPGWVQGLDRALAAVTVCRDPAAARLVIQQLVTSQEPGEPDVAWFVTVDGTSVRAHPGRAEHADVTFTQDRAVAEAVNRGELQPREAFMLGQIRIGGDVQRLVGEQEVLRAVAGAFPGIDRAR